MGTNNDYYTHFTEKDTWAQRGQVVQLYQVVNVSANI